MSEKEEELSQDLLRLERVLKRTLFGSKEFKNLKKKIIELGLEINILLVVMTNNRYRKVARTKNKKLKCKLSAEDIEFLRKSGIRW